MLDIKLLISGLWCAAALLSAGVAAKEPVRIGGTGMALEAMRIAAAELAPAGLVVDVLPSLGSSGGMKALAAGEIDIALVARDLTAAERSSGLQTSMCMTTALIFATSLRSSPAALAVRAVPGIFADPAPRWPDGTPLRIILRSRNGSENPLLVKMVPGMEQALEAAYRRLGIPIGATDQENAEIAQTTNGSLAVMTLLQLRAEKLALHPVALDGLEPTVEAVADGRYPMTVPICVIRRADGAPDTARFLESVGGEPGRALLRRLGAASTG